MRHMGLDKVARTQGTVQTKFTSEDTRSDYARKLARIIAWRRGMSATNTEEVEHGGLGLEDSAATDCADFD
jgi:hypothetical protein